MKNHVLRKLVLATREKLDDQTWQTPVSYLELTCVLWTPKVDRAFSRANPLGPRNPLILSVRADHCQTFCQLLDPFERSWRSRYERWVW